MNQLNTVVDYRLLTHFFTFEKYSKHTKVVLINNTLNAVAQSCYASFVRLCCYHNSLSFRRPYASVYRRKRWNRFPILVCARHESPKTEFGFSNRCNVEVSRVIQNANLICCASFQVKFLGPKFFWFSYLKRSCQEMRYAYRFNKYKSVRLHNKTNLWPSILSEIKSSTKVI